MFGYYYLFDLVLFLSVVVFDMRFEWPHTQIRSNCVKSTLIASNELYILSIININNLDSLAC